MKRRRARIEPRAWTAAEDEKLREICAIGLASDHWHLALPGRTFGEIAERRLDLGLRSAMLP
jgi:hypothetical protein